MPASSQPKAGNIKSTTLLNHAILEAATRHGNDGKGKDDLTGYCRFLAEAHPTAFATLLGRVLPMQVAAAGPAKLEFMVTFIRPDGNPDS